ncbi:MAG TPA: hypothetical protein VFU21_08945 [Kofleriaceae bacterium]|nr:hypothetical protein [Kofleriaceae bacterium]
MALAVAGVALGPVALGVAWLGLERPFLIVLAAALAADIALDNVALPPLPGWLGRALAWSELAVRAAIPLGLYWLRPYLLETEPFAFWTTVAALSVPVAGAFIKYGRAPRYRTRVGVVALYLSAGAALFLVATGATWPFRLATLALGLAALEEIAITLALPEPRAPVRSFPAALRARKG